MTEVIRPNTRTITIFPKQTGANTQYYEMSEQDEAYIYHWLTQFSADMLYECTFDADLQKEIFRRKPNAFPKSFKGPNSIGSMIGGILGDKLRNPERNISEPQRDPLESIFDTLASYYEDCDAIRFKLSLFEQ